MFLSISRDIGIKLNLGLIFIKQESCGSLAGEAVCENELLLFMQIFLLPL